MHIIYKIRSKIIFWKHHKLNKHPKLGENMATAKKSTKKDLEAKIADLEAKLNKLAASQETTPAEAPPKPAESKVEEKPKAEAKVEEKPKAEAKVEEKPAETAPKPAEKAPSASGELHEKFREIPTGNWNTQKVAITGFTAPSDRYFGSRALVAKVTVAPSNWNDQKTKITGYTAPGNKYFATKQRLAYHPEAKKFGTWIENVVAAEKAKPAEAKAEEKPAEAKGPHGHDEKPAESTTEAQKEAQAQKDKEEYIARMAKKGATLPKGFIKDAKAAGAH